MWELKIHVILYLIQIYCLTKYLVENAENSISETLDFKIFLGSTPQTPLEASTKGARFCEHHLKNSNFWAPPLQIMLHHPWQDQHTESQLYQQKTSHTVFEEVTSFDYLSVVSIERGSNEDIKVKVNKARAAFNMLRKVWSSHVISQRTKLRIFNTNVKAILLYGSETCGTTK